MTDTVTDNVNDRIRVVVVDDHTVMRAGVIALTARGPSSWHWNEG
ncbi:hypothetical protein ACH4S9_12085 [Streptomyces sp. NPDC021225]